jgi:DNA sulfur modification protein DndC
MSQFGQNFPSFFETKTTNDLYQEIQETYLCNDYPWVIGYSGGKDSTTTTQLIWYALSKIPKDKLFKPIFIISSDTLVETPIVVNQINTTLSNMKKASEKQGLPFSIHKVTPKVDDTFWVNMIGRGYPAPTNRFRWCTDRLKIEPANTFVLNQAAKFGEVVMILGARKSESMSRNQVLNDESRQIPGTKLTRHSSLSRAYVYTPIEDFTTDDVWTYLLQVQSPWGSNNRDLAALYRSSQSGDCPLVIDKNTPSCGNSRFGCWVCTVVEKDKTMEALIDNGEEWLEPLLDFRDRLSETQNPDRKLEFRDFKRRNGQTIYKDGRFIPGPYKPEFRKELLRRLLSLQLQLREESPNSNLNLITEEELHAIRKIWRTELSDWEDSVPTIYKEVTGEKLDWLEEETSKFSQDEYKLLEELCKKYNISLLLVTRLIDLEKRMQGMGRRTGIYRKIESLFSEEWRNQAEIIEQLNEDHYLQENLGLD